MISLPMQLQNQLVLFILFLVTGHRIKNTIRVTFPQLPSYLGYILHFHSYLGQFLHFHSYLATLGTFYISTATQLPQVLFTFPQLPSYLGYFLHFHSYLATLGTFYNCRITSTTNILINICLWQDYFLQAQQQPFNSRGKYYDYLLG